MGYGRRYLADLDTTVTDLCVFAAEKLFEETKYRRQDIDLLIFVNQKPDYREPCDACIAHGLLELKKIVQQLISCKAVQDMFTVCGWLIQ